ncbi:MAG: hypothetical protein ABH859_05840 [Pseudomonadota bacterium]
MKLATFLLSLIIITCLFVTTGCQKVALYSDLSEEDVNEMLVLLSENGIDAKKQKEVRQNDVFWSIAVSEAEMNKARSLLMQHNLPRKRELGLTGIYKEKALIPTPDEQKARYILALKGEIINSLERLGSVVDADVVLNVPTKDEFATEEEKMTKRPTASVIVKLIPPAAGQEPLTEAKIQRFVANAVENMNARDVTVIMSYLTTDKRQQIRPGEVASITGSPSGVQAPLIFEDELVGLKLDEASKKRLKIYLLIFFLLLILLSTGLIVTIVQASRTRRKLAEIKQHGGTYPAIEGQVMHEGPPRLEGTDQQNEL